MITIAKCYDITEAQRLRMVLESAGIPVLIPDEMTASVASYWFINNSGVRVQVAEEHVAAAREVIEEEKSRS